MKRFFLILIGLALTFASSAKETQVDTVAVIILNRMADVIGDLNSCSFKLTTFTDVTDFENGTIKQSGIDEVYLAGPDKMMVNFYGDKGHRGCWYNGEKVSYYSFDENNFSTLDAPTTILAAIDSLNQNYDIEFPAADFFYPSFTDDILHQFDHIAYLGLKEIDNQECFHILASNKDMSFQFWIANDAYNLPKKFVLTYKKKDNMQYEATFSNWALNPEIPNSVFEFLPPPMARKVVLLPKIKK